MKLDLKLSLLVITGWFPVSVAAQVLPWPQDPYGMDYHVDSAYGPRYLGVDANGKPKPGTFFHKGIDLNGQNTYGDEDINYPLLAPTYGAIFGIGKTTNGLKWIGIDYGNGRSFGYLHIFPDNEPDSKGDFVGVSLGASIRSYRRIYTDFEKDANSGVILFYSLPDNKGRIVKALGINGIHTDTQVKVPENPEGKDIQVSSVGYIAQDEGVIVVDGGTDSVLNTLRQGDDVVVGNTIRVGGNKIAESRAGYVVPQTSVVPGEIIAPLGKSGYQDAAHLHLQISSPDDPFLYNEKYPVDFRFNDGWNNVVQYLPRPQLTKTPYSGGITSPAAGSIVYHTADHNNNERVKAAIRWVPPDTVLATYRNYELDLVKLFAIPKTLIDNPSEIPGFVADDTHLINSGRNVQLTNANTLPNPNDPFRAEFNYGGAVGDSPVDADNAFPPFLNNTSSKYRSDGIVTGLIAQGSLQANPVTEFIYNQWNTRISKDSFWAMAPGLAYRSQDAAYPDGDYSLVVTAESVDRDPLEKFVSEEPVLVAVDNFRPYVERVQVRDVTEPLSPAVVYERAWARDGAVLKPVDLKPQKALLAGRSYEVSVYLSEYTESAMVLFEGAGLPILSDADNTDTHTSEYHFSLGAPGYREDRILPLQINDMDWNRNGLLALAAARKEITPALELVHNAAGIMQGTAGPDEHHRLRFDGAPPVISYDKGYSALPEPQYRCADGAGCGSAEAPVIISYSPVRLRWEDIGSGLKSVKIHPGSLDATPAFEFNLPEGSALLETSTEAVPLADGRYIMVA